MSDLFPAYPDGFQAEDAEHVPAENRRQAPPAEGYQAEEREHSPLEEERGAENS
jgi:hypothetical protein